MEWSHSISAVLRNLKLEGSLARVQAGRLIRRLHGRVTIQAACQSAKVAKLIPRASLQN
jgi:hypothetical protein